jgi:nicotinate-nucleotide pyrophosphorylase (carboxylating)
MSSASQKLDPSAYRALVAQALAEDASTHDITTGAIVSNSDLGRGMFLAKAPLTLAGCDVALEVFRQIDPETSSIFHFNDGDDCPAGVVIGEVRGRARTLLSGERIALNFLQHLSGVATLSRQFVQAADKKITILDTRKTTPLFRVLEKYAVRTGGATNHRTSLEDWFLIKDNHIRMAGDISTAVAGVKASGVTKTIEVEVTNLAEVAEALEAGADMLLLDNMSVEEIREAVRRTGGRAKTEISGGVTLARIPELAATGADYVSSGALTHSAPSVDISFEIEPA